ncbi:MAG: DUF421 domain-containing protein [Clostridia bacterium]|nr:DUF421 domain-containing protein [Clostridia bacterium]
MLAIIIFRTLIVYFALVASMRLMGKRQLGELELPELVVAVLIADLASHPLQDIGIPLINGLLPIIILFCCETILSGAAMKSVKLRSLLFGRPCFLIEKGKIKQDEMRKNRFTLDELTEELRGSGITDISLVEYAVLETNGQLNTLLFPEARPATAKDMNVAPADNGYTAIIINDGRIMSQNLKIMGRDLNWLEKELKRRGAACAENVYLMTLDNSGNVYFAAKETKK